MCTHKFGSIGSINVPNTSMRNYALLKKTVCKSADYQTLLLCAYSWVLIVSLLRLLLQQMGLASLIKPQNVL